MPVQREAGAFPVTDVIAQYGYYFANHGHYTAENHDPFLIFSMKTMASSAGE